MVHSLLGRRIPLSVGELPLGATISVPLIHYSHLDRQWDKLVNMAQSHSTLFIHATIITVNSSREVIHDGYLLVENTRIAAIGKCPVPPDLTASKTIDCTRKIIIPGLINTHAHLVQSLLRGLAEDLPLHNWLCDAIWPLESVYDDRDGYHAARLTMAEMLKTGTTCFLDPMVTYRAGWENVCAAVDEMGMRGCLVSCI
jgi:cytosine/adenosine deaminase-related metal-dependent hydrolase